MANRILIGNRATGGYGIYVGQSGEDVLTTTNALQFDSRMGASTIIHSYGQGSIAGGGAAQTITHNLGYYPLFAVRWSEPENISGGVATKTYNVADAEMTYTEYEEEEESASGGATWGCSVGHTNTNTITVTNLSSADGDNDTATLRALYYAIVIFHEADFTGGIGL